MSEKEQTSDLTFAPVNMGQALGVLADIVATYVSTAGSGVLDDQKKQTQLSLTIFLHSLLMRAKHKTELADLLDIISAELREQAKREAMA
jgi:hypothetical protein